MPHFDLYWIEKLPAQNSGGLYKTNGVCVTPLYRPVRPELFGTDRARFRYPTVAPYTYRDFSFSS
jgi:hypothetical protein